MEVTIRTKDRKLNPSEETHIRKRLDRLPQVEPISDGVEFVREHAVGGAPDTSSSPPLL